ncbi:AcrR family transcriptional regulator [Kibdelosporangium banguiense]|uniref:AcrR family transcriptional regulator n=1 Tax=Kibdelosporangium banguiense TaxID=1365924 RepID=A0ABS4TYF6_9PSEU|nr:TetR/AcrR family transcriptional regulator [Kibdelosporangium banguiense]MBP2329433.1 AcrR family transcriptional regulator [Kibdelosporangium banguiense]
MNDRTEVARRAPLRADAQRNRERLLSAALQLLAESNRQLAMEAVARRAGVSIATLYRHFPTREALFLTIYRHEMQELGRWADELAARLSSSEALAQWLMKMGRYASTRPGMAEAFRAALIDGEQALMEDAYSETTEALGRLLERAAAAGAIRSDIGADDLLLALCGVWELPDTPAGRQQADRVVGLLLDGLRTDTS